MRMRLGGRFRLIDRLVGGLTTLVCSPPSFWQKRRLAQAMMGNSGLELNDMNICRPPGLLHVLTSIHYSILPSLKPLTPV